MNDRLDQPTIDFIRDNIDRDVRFLALKAAKYPGVDMKKALVQIEGRQKARQKIPSWAATEGVIYPPHLSMEQCSSEMTALYKAQIAKRLITDRGLMVDLTAGFGIDFYFIGCEFRHAVYVERQEVLCDVAKNNFLLLGMKQIEVFCGDGIDYLESMKRMDLIFIDPARRDANGGRTIGLKDCTPDITLIEDTLLAKSEYILLKLSPMLDWHQVMRELRNVIEIHIVSVGNECREMLAVMSDKGSDGITIYCTNDNSVFKFRSDNVRIPAISCSEDFKYLYEPNSSIMKAGCFGAISEEYHVKSVENNSHLFVGKSFINDFPGRKFVINKIFSLNKRDLKDNLSGLSQANITVRNFPMTVAELRKKLKLRDGGSVYLFATTLSDGSKVIINCSRC
jgi:hypothetical protein